MRSFRNWPKSRIPERYKNVRLNSAIGYITPEHILAGYQQEIQAVLDRKIGGTEGTAKESPLGGHVIDYFRLADRSADGLQREFKDETKLRVGIWHARVSVRQSNTVHQQTHHSHRDEGDHKIPSGKRRNCLCRPGS